MDDDDDEPPFLHSMPHFTANPLFIHSSIQLACITLSMESIFLASFGNHYLHWLIWEHGSHLTLSLSHNIMDIERLIQNNAKWKLSHAKKLRKTLTKIHFIPPIDWLWIDWLIVPNNLTFWFFFCIFLDSCTLSWRVTYTRARNCWLSRRKRCSSPKTINTWDTGRATATAAPTSRKTINCLNWDTGTTAAATTSPNTINIWDITIIISRTTSPKVREHWHKMIRKRNHNHTTHTTGHQT